MKHTRVVAFAFALAVAMSSAVDARAQDDDGDAKPTTPSPSPASPAPVPATISISANKPDAVIDTGPPAEAPPARPWSKGIVVEGSVGVLGFFGAFRRLAPPAFFQRIQAGYEIFDWLMVFGGGELAFTDTSVGQDPSKSRAFPIWGFDGGARLTVRPFDRVGIFVQGTAGMMKADVPANALAIVGFPDTEELSPVFGGRIGVEWYQVDRHLSFGVAGGPRLATGFERSFGKGDTPLMADGAVTLRYTF